MLQIALLLCGRHFIIQNKHFLTIAALCWGLLGATILADGMLGAHYFPLTLFGWLMLCESLCTLIVAFGIGGAKRGIYLFKGGITLSVALLIISGFSASNLLLAIILGFTIFLSGTILTAAAWIVRYPQWKRAIASGIGQIIFAVFLFHPYPAHHDGTVSQFLGVLMFLSAVDCLLLSLRLKALGPGITIFDVQFPDKTVRMPTNSESLSSKNTEQQKVSTPELRVLIWTPEGAADNETVRRPILNRYIAAVDVDGVISTGHAALEMQDVYLSLYPAVDIDRSPSEFFRTLKAVRENDVPGRFQESYVSEAAEWCEADKQVCFHKFSAESLRVFNEHYQRKKIYNLTRRNCSSSVAFALEAALDGVLNRESRWSVFIRLFFQPELWIAAQLRHRAVTMAWTPGLLLDYSRALHGLVHPVSMTWPRRSTTSNQDQNNAAGR